MSDPEPQSPCISVCMLDENDICIGCFRSADEITDWLMASAEEKRDILRLSEKRQRADQPRLIPQSEESATRKADS